MNREQLKQVVLQSLTKEEVHAKFGDCRKAATWQAAYDYIIESEYPVAPTSTATEVTVEFAPVDSAPVELEASPASIPALAPREIKVMVQKKRRLSSAGNKLAVVFGCIITATIATLGFYELSSADSVCQCTRPVGVSRVE